MLMSLMNFSHGTPALGFRDQLHLSTVKPTTIYITKSRYEIHYISVCRKILYVGFIEISFVLLNNMYQRRLIRLFSSYSIYEQYCQIYHINYRFWDSEVWCNCNNGICVLGDVTIFMYIKNIKQIINGHFQYLSMEYHIVYPSLNMKTSHKY